MLKFKKIVKIKKSMKKEKIDNIINKYNLSANVIYAALERTKKIELIIL